MAVEELTYPGLRAVVDFRGARFEGVPRVIDDLRAYAHFVNNRGFERVIRARRGGRPVPWRNVLQDFALEGFGPSLLGSVVVSATAWLASWTIGPTGRVEVLVVKHRRP